MMITDSAFYRNRNYHTPEDTAEKLDYKRMAMVVEGVYAVVMNWRTSERHRLHRPSERSV